MEPVKIKISNEAGESIELTMEEAKSVYDILTKLFVVQQYYYPEFVPLKTDRYDYPIITCESLMPPEFSKTVDDHFWELI